jgi:hypothetical protein
VNLRTNARKDDPIPDEDDDERSYPADDDNPALDWDTDNDDSGHD